MNSSPPPSVGRGYHHGSVSAGTNIHYVDIPSSHRPLMLVHGVGMDWRVWQAVARRFVPRFHVYMVDLRGHGESGKPRSGYALRDYAADIEDVLVALGLRDVVLVGSSLGGAVAAVVEAPVELVARRVLVDPPLTFGPLPDVKMMQEIAALKHEPVETLAAYLRQHNPGVGQHLLRTMSEMWHQAADGVVEEMLAHPDDFYASEREVQYVESPTLLLQADPQRDAVLTDSDACRALALLPHGTLVRVAGAGHAIHAHRPAEFVALVEHFAAPHASGAVTGSEGDAVQ